jgi:hypothetical protein
MYSRDFHNWCYFLTKADFNNSNHTKMVGVIKNHLALVKKCEIALQVDSFAYLVDSFLCCFGEKTKYNVNHLNFIGELAEAICFEKSRRNTNTTDKAAKSDFAYALQGYLEVMNPNEIPAEFCIDFLETQPNDTKEYFPECNAGLLAGIRRGSIKGDQLTWMKNELAEYFVHVIDPSLPGEIEENLRVHKGLKNGLLRSEGHERIYTC